MANKIKKTTEEFIEEIKKIYKDSNIDFSKVDYKGRNKEVILICPKHGEYSKTPKSILSGHGYCPKCRRNILTKEEFLDKANKVHNNFYNYDKLELRGNKNEIIVTCPKHGDFKTTPYLHLKGHKCKECSYEESSLRQRKSKEQFIKDAQDKHWNNEKNEPLYDYSEIDYINAFTEVCIICPIHGKFWQTPNKHLQGHGCQKCFANNKKTNEEFKEELKNIFGDLYDLSLIDYKGAKKEKVKLICPKHGIFEAKPKDLLNKKGCPYCKESKLEKEVNGILYNIGIEFNRIKRFDWLGKQSFDFYIPKLNLAIECQGIQHYGNSKFKTDKTYELDIKKYNLCMENNIKLIYVFSNRTNLDKEIFENKELKIYNESNSFKIKVLKDYLIKSWQIGN